MKFTKRDDILLAWENGGIEYYIPLVQSLGINMGTNVAEITQSSTYEKRQEILTAPIIDIPIEILGTDNVINEEIYFLNPPTETEQAIFNSINNPINLLVLLNDKNEYDDLIKTVESISKGEKHDVYGLKIYNCYLTSYSLSIEAGGLISHKLNLSGENINAERIELTEAKHKTDLAPKNIGVAYKFNLCDINGVVNQPVTSLSINLNIDRKTKYTFKRNSDPNYKDNFELAPKINKAESSSECTINITTVSDLKSKEFTTEWLRDSSRLLKDFRIIHDELDNDGFPTRTSINFYDIILTSVEIEEDVNGLMNISYSFSVSVPTEAIKTVHKGITTRKRYEKYFRALDVNGLKSINPDFRNDTKDGAWDWELDNLINANYAFDSNTTTDSVEKFNTPSCPKLLYAVNMFYKHKKMEFNCSIPNVQNINAMFAARYLGPDYGLIGEFKQVLPNLELANSVFEGNENLESVHIEAPKLIEAGSIFLECKNLKSIYFDAPKVKRMNYGFNTTSSCESYIIPSGFPELESAYSLFDGSAISKVPWGFPKATNCAYMFNKTTRLEEVDLYLPECTVANNFGSYSTSLKKVIVDFPKCTNVGELVRNCQNLEELIIKNHSSTDFGVSIYQTTNLKRLEVDFSNVKSMGYFGERSGLPEFRENLGKVTQFFNAFMEVNNMKEFNSALPNVTSGAQGFRWSQNLTTFRYPIDEDGNSIYESGKPQATNSDGTGLFEYLKLPRLNRGRDMFSAMRVDLPSALSIFNSLRQREDIPNPTDERDWTITMSMENTYQNNIELINAIEGVKSRGWTVLMQWQQPRTRSLRSRSSENGLPALLNNEDLYLLKKVEADSGIFEDEFGRRFEIVGGNEIFCDGKTASQLGYQKFSSYEEAVDKWRLVYKGTKLPEDL